MPTVIQDTNANARWSGHIAGSGDPTITKYRLYVATNDQPGAYRLVEQKNPTTTNVVGEAVGTGNGVQTVFNLANPNVFVATAVVRVNGVVKTQGVDYTLTTGGVITFTVAPPNTQPVTADYTYAPNTTFGPYAYGDMHLITPNRPFYVKIVAVRGNVDDLQKEPTFGPVTPSQFLGWTLAQLLEQDVRPVIVVGLDPITGLFYPLNVITDGGSGFKLKT